jgi:thioredoxin reductase/bacterioferritin-associated ferredoxin
MGESQSCCACDLVVVGGGPAGVEAALAAARHGLSVTMVDEGSQPAALRLRPVTTCFDHIVWSVSPGFRVDALGPEGPVSWHARAVIAATGADERVVPFPGWTLPGVSGLTAAPILPGALTLVAGQGPLLFAAATGILQAGGRVAAVVDLAGRAASWCATLQRAGVPVLHGHAIARVAEAEGDRLIATLTAVDAAGRPMAGGTRDVVVDAVAVGNGFTASTEITRLLRVAHHYDGLRGGWVPRLDDGFRTTLPGLYVAGDAAGLGGAAAIDGGLAGLAAALDLGALSAEDHARQARALRDDGRRAHGFGLAMAQLMALRPAQVAAIPGETNICRCEDVTRAQIDAAAAEGAKTLNQLKAWTRCGMGSCQGRICGDVAGALLAGEDGRREAVGQFTGRTPFRPLPLDQLAGEVDYAALTLPPAAPL